MSDEIKEIYSNNVLQSARTWRNKQAARHPPRVNYIPLELLKETTDNYLRRERESQ